MRCDGGFQRHLQIVEQADEGGVLAVAFAVVGFDGAQDAAQPVHELKQAGDDGLVGGEFSVAQHAEEVFPGVGHFFESLEAEKAGCALDGVDGAKDFAEEFLILGTLLEIGKTALHPVEAFLAFDEELSG